MTLNPSCNNVAGKRLPNLGDPPFDAKGTQIAVAEIASVIPPEDLSFANETKLVRTWKVGSTGWRMANYGMRQAYEGEENDQETVSLEFVIASAYGWTFKRAWYYWVARTSSCPVPLSAAEKLNETWGRQVRVDGYSGETNTVGDVASYHVDTLDGLRALVDVIRTINKSRARL